jgi:hypothetical protein
MVDSLSESVYRDFFLFFFVCEREERKRTPNLGFWFSGQENEWLGF